MNDQLDVDALVEQATAAIASASSTEAIRQVAASVSGKKSPLAVASRSLGRLDPDVRRQLGQQLHEARTTVERLLEQRRSEISATELSREMSEARIDLTEFIPGSIPAPPAAGPPAPGHTDPR